MNYSDLAVLNFALTGTIAAGAVAGQLTAQEYYFYKPALLISLQMSAYAVETAGGKLHIDNKAVVGLDYVKENRPYCVEGVGAGAKSITYFAIMNDMVHADLYRYVTANEPIKFFGDLYEDATVGKQIDYTVFCSLFYLIT